MSISENKKNEARGRDVWRMPVLIYGGYSLFLLIFSLVYQIFAHGVHSFYMTWLPCFTFIPGFLPMLAVWKTSLVPEPGELSSDLYHAGVAAMTVSALLRGIFEIAGTTSVYQRMMMQAGIILLVAGLLIYLFQSLLRLFKYAGRS